MFQEHDATENGQKLDTLALSKARSEEPAGLKNTEQSTSPLLNTESTQLQGANANYTNAPFAEIFFPKTLFKQIISSQLSDQKDSSRGIGLFRGCIVLQKDSASSAKNATEK
jgi:hypothetical protein